MLVNHASVDKSLIKELTNVLHQDQLAHATSLWMPKTNARIAQPTLFQSMEMPVPTTGVSIDMLIQLDGKTRLPKLEDKEELWLSQLNKTASLEANSMELKNNATLVNPALVDKSSTNQPTHAILDHLLLVIVSKRDLQMDTLV
jgi:hypothetical protein